MSNKVKKARPYRLPEFTQAEAFIDKLITHYSDVLNACDDSFDEAMEWATKLAGDRCECKNVFLTAGGVRYTQCDPCAFREWAGLQEPDPSE